MPYFIQRLIAGCHMLQKSFVYIYRNIKTVFQSVLEAVNLKVSDVKDNKLRTKVFAH